MNVESVKRHRRKRHNTQLNVQEKNERNEARSTEYGTVRQCIRATMLQAYEPNGIKETKDLFLDAFGF